MGTRERRDRRHEDDLFGHGRGESAAAIDVLVQGVRRERARPVPRPRSAVRARPARRGGRVRRARPSPRPFEIRHPVLLGTRYVVHGLVAAIGVVMIFGFAVTAAGHYSQAAALAHAPACSSGTDPLSTNADCVATETMSFDFGVYDDETALDVYPKGDPDALYLEQFPASAPFSDASEDAHTVRATVWEGRVVAMTIGSATVVTDDNPNNAAGRSVSGALVGTFLALLNLWLTGVSRPVRRWLPPHPAVPVVLTGMAVCAVASLVTAIALSLQPDRVLAAGIAAPCATAVVGFAACLVALGATRGSRAAAAFAR